MGTNEMKDQQEYLNDIKNNCGCYQLGDECYDREGDFTHSSNEECTE